MKTCDPPSALPLLAGRAGVRMIRGGANLGGRGELTMVTRCTRSQVSSINQSCGLLFPHTHCHNIMAWTRLRHIQTKSTLTGNSINLCYRALTRHGEITRIKYLWSGGFIR